MELSLNNTLGDNSSQHLEEYSIAADVLQKVKFLAEVADNLVEQQFKELEAEVQNEKGILESEKTELVLIEEDIIRLKCQSRELEDVEAEETFLEQSFAEIAVFNDEEESLKGFEESIKNLLAETANLDERYALTEEEMNIRAEEEAEVDEELEKIDSSIQLKHEITKQNREKIEELTDKRDKLREKQNEMELEIVDRNYQKMSKNSVDRGNGKLIECAEYTEKLKKETQEMRDSRFSFLDQNAALQQKLEAKRREATKYGNHMSDETLAVYDKCRNLLSRVGDGLGIKVLNGSVQEIMEEKDEAGFVDILKRASQKHEFLIKEMDKLDINTKVAYQVETEKADKRKAKISNKEYNPVEYFLSMIAVTKKEA